MARPEPTKIRINEFVQERHGISADTALRLARFFNTSHQFWLNLRGNYDVKCTDDAPGEVNSRIQPWNEPAGDAAA